MNDMQMLTNVTNSSFHGHSLLNPSRFVVVVAWCCCLFLFFFLKQKYNNKKCMLPTQTFPTGRISAILDFILGYFDFFDLLVLN